MRLPDQATGTALVAVGGLAAAFGSRLPGVPGQDIGPAVFPMLIGAFLAACGGAIALGVGRGFEAPDPAEEAPPPRYAGLRALLPPALLLFYVLIVERLGFLPTAAAMVAAVALALGAGWRIVVPLAVAAPLGVHLVFAKLLRVPLPDGVLPAPW